MAPRFLPNGAPMRGSSRHFVRIAGSALATFLATILPAALLSGCRQPRDPQAIYDHARETLRKGDPEAAASEAEKGYNDFHALSPDWSWKFTILRARVLYAQGKNEQALAMLASGPATGPTGESAVQKLRWEGLAYTSLHKFSEAEHALSEAERLCSVKDYRVCGDVLGAEGDLEMERGHYWRAQIFFERVLAAARSSGDPFWEASALLDLSWSADEQAHFDETLDWADSARKLAVPGGYTDIAQTALGNMGWAYYRLGDPEKALNMFTEAGKQAQKLGDATDEIKWLTNAGYIYMDDRDFATAERSFTQSLNLSRQLNSQEDIINSLIALGFVSEQTGKLDDAKRYADEALARAQHDQNGRDAVYPELVLGRIAARVHDTSSAEKAFRQVGESPDSPVFLKWEAQRSIARLYQDEGQYDRAERGYRAALSTFETARSELRDVDSRLPFLSNAAHIYDDYIGLLIKRGKFAEALQVADFSRARTVQEGLGLLSKRTLLTPELLNARQIASHAGGTVLYYRLSEEQSYLWVVTSRRIALFQLPSAAEIKSRVEHYRTAIIEQRESTPAASEEGTALYRILVEPAEGLIGQQARVFIVPDGCLYSLSFETLRTPGAQPHYWIQDVTLSTASSLRMLQTFHTEGNRIAHNLLLFGDPVPPNEDFPQLRNASLEVAEIEQHFYSGQREIFSRERATPSAYLTSRPERFSFIHFVAHGTASRLSPLDSAIVLSRDRNQDSYKLDARQILGQRLQADLVTISSCRSAGERAYSGEGLVGLAWAFVGAGAHNVIGALWDVSDASSPQLMNELYSELKKGTAPDRALRRAKLTLLRSSGSLQKPFYWAPFQLYNGS